MKIVDFPDPKDEMREFPPELVPREYQFQMNMHTNFIKQQSDQNFFYMKFLGLFLLISGAYFVLQDKGVLSNFLIGTVILGVGTLYIMLTHVIFLDPQWDWKVTRCIKTGKFLEEKYPHIIPSDLFHTFDDLQPISFRGALVSRFGPFALVLILTTAAGMALSSKVGLWLTVSVGIFAAAFLIGSFFFFRWFIKRNFK
jgi:hypothetical protein